MRTPRVSDERGMALVMAIFALVVIGAIVAGTFFTGRTEQRSGQNVFYATQAAEAANAGLLDAAANWDPITLNSMAIGSEQTLATSSLGGNTYSTPKVKRLNSSLLLVSSTGERRNAAGGVIAQRLTGRLIRLIPAKMKMTAGLTAFGATTISGNAKISGYDQTPGYWSSSGVSCPGLDSVAGIRYNGSPPIVTGSAQVEGDPPTQLDLGLTHENSTGGSPFSQLKTLTTLTLTGDITNLAPVVVGTPPRCDKSVQNNWGAPVDKTSPCFTYFPIIYRNGNLNISGSGAGQGILLVEGDLQVQGRIDFYGPVIVTGTLRIRGTGSDDVKFHGGIVAQNVDLANILLTGNATVNYSSCAIRRALDGSAKVAPLAQRSWVQLY